MRVIYKYTEVVSLISYRVFVFFIEVIGHWENCRA